MRPPRPWTEPQLQLVATMVAIGASTASIARAVRHTHRAVTGLLHRRGWRRTAGQRAAIRRGQGVVTKAAALSAQKDSNVVPLMRQLSEATIARLYAGQRYDCSGEWNRRTRESYLGAQRQRATG